MRRATSGVVTFARVKPISKKIGIGLEKHDREGRTITLEYKKFFLVNVVVPNVRQNYERMQYRIDEWDKDFYGYLTMLNR